MTIRLLVWLIATALVGLSAYLGMAFVSWDFHPQNWTELSRLICAALPGYFAVKTFDEIVDE